MDSTGLRVHGGREWMREKHGLPKARKTWRKLHIGFDPESGELVASCLTPQHVGDTGALPELLAEVSGPVRRFIGDGAYDGVPTAATIRHAFGPDLELIIPPLHYCTDNAAMIAAAGTISYRKGKRSSLHLNANPGLELGI